MQPPAPTEERQARVPKRESRPLTHFEMMAARVPDVQAPALPRRGQRQYLRRLRGIYAAKLNDSGLNRATRRKLAKEVKFA